MNQSSEHYTGVARFLHWLMAVLILGQLIGGFAFGHKLVSGDLGFQVVQLHKSFGLVVLVLSVVRLVWRLMHKPPALPTLMPAWEKALAGLTHILFYVVMVATPLAGWLYISASPLGIQTQFFGLFEVPLLPLPQGAELAETLSGLHEFFAFATIGLFGLHVAAALKHYFIEKDQIVTRMAGRGLGPWLGFALAAAAGAALIFVFAQPYDEAGDAASAVAQPGQTVEAAQGDHAWQIVPEDTFLTVDVHAKQATRQARFDEISGTIILDPSNPERHGLIDVAINTRSITSDEHMARQLASELSWLNIGQFPEAFFNSEDIRLTSDGGYLAKGALTLKGVSHPADLTFTLDVSGDQAIAEGVVSFDRAEWQVGVSDVDDTQVTANVTVVATRAAN
ncbi:MAG: hypothetical protein CMK09_04060 [Ponticaulis sp.]|nr:hypothetical protein [Ponticaulis sp.]|tara:strand:- start:13122 stop:14303 length:1182 start_codon:yes stop_codon:yes gene_type:complete